MNITDIQIIRDRILEGYYDVKKSYPSKTKEMKDGYITDEDQYVKWNREQVELAKQKYRQLQDEYQDEVNRTVKLFCKDTKEYIINTCKCTDEAAKVIFDKAYEEGHANGYNDILYYIDTYLDLINMFIDANK